MEEIETSNFRQELESLINKYSKENESNTPDFILSNYLTNCLFAYNSAVLSRDQWYGFNSNFELSPTSSALKEQL